MLSVCLPPPIKLLSAWTKLNETPYIYQDTWAHFGAILHKSLWSVCLHLYPLLSSRQWLGKRVPTATSARNNRIIGDVVFYAVHVTSKERLCVSVYPPAVARQQIVGGIIFYVVRVVSKESWWLVLPRTSCLYIIICQEIVIAHASVRQGNCW
jgi:hypothetical protein